MYLTEMLMMESGGVIVLSAMLRAAMFLMEVLMVKFGGNALTDLPPPRSLHACKSTTSAWRTRKGLLVAVVPLR